MTDCKLCHKPIDDGEVEFCHTLQRRMQLPQLDPVVHLECAVRQRLIDKVYAVIGEGLVKATLEKMIEADHAKR